MPFERGERRIKTSMRPTKRLLLAVLLLWAGISAGSNMADAQEVRADLPDSPSQSVGAKHGREADREVTWRSAPKDFLHDQKGIWLFPTQLAKGQYWLPTLAIVGGTAGLLVADPHVMPYFRDHGPPCRCLP